MIRNVEIYRGKEIDVDKISRLKEIAVSRCAEPIYIYYYSCIENVDELAFFHDVHVDDEILILGEDWFCAIRYQIVLLHS